MSVYSIREQIQFIGNDSVFNVFIFKLFACVFLYNFRNESRSKQPCSLSMPDQKLENQNIQFADNFLRGEIFLKYARKYGRKYANMLQIGSQFFFVNALSEAESIYLKNET